MVGRWNLTIAGTVVTRQGHEPIRADCFLGFLDSLGLSEHLLHSGAQGFGHRIVSGSPAFLEGQFLYDLDDADVVIAWVLVETAHVGGLPGCWVRTDRN